MTLGEASNSWAVVGMVDFSEADIIDGQVVAACCTSGGTDRRGHRRDASRSRQGVCRKKAAKHS